MSTSTDAAEIYSKFIKLPKVSEREIMRVTSPATTTRFKILKAIATRLEKQYNTTNLYYVDYINLKPHLFLQQDGVEKTFNFTNALSKFHQLIEKLDFSEIRNFAVTHKMKSSNLEQFVVL